MKANHIKYNNLRAEMARRNIGICDLSNATGMSRDRLSRKLSGKSALCLDEAFCIQRAMFSDIDLCYLFATAENPPDHPRQDAS